MRLIKNAPSGVGSALHNFFAWSGEWEANKKVSHQNGTSKSALHLLSTKNILRN